MKTIEVSSALPVPADFAARLMMRSDTLVYESDLVTFDDADSFPEVWEAGYEFSTNLTLFGFIPMGEYGVKFTEVNHEEMYFATEEGGGVIKSWNHKRYIEDIIPEACFLVDVVEIDAGILTSVVCSMATRLYTRRQARWHKLIQKEAVLQNAL